MKSLMKKGKIMERMKLMKLMKRGLAVFLSATLLLGAVPPAAVSAEPSETAAVSANEIKTDLPLPETVSGNEEPKTDASENNAQEKENQSAPELDYIYGRPMTEEEIAFQESLMPDYLPEIEGFDIVENPGDFTDLYSSQTLETKYDSRDLGILPSVKNQGNWGTCWAFSTMGALETSMILQGQTPSAVDFSERHLAWFAYHTGYDRLGHSDGDTKEITPTDGYLRVGGNARRATAALMNWQGAGAESEFPYIGSGNVGDLSAQDAQKSGVYLENTFFIHYPEPEQMKAAIKEYGCVEWSYYHNGNFYRADTGAYFNNADMRTNHSILIVGWDDEYSKLNFKEGCQPQEDGAWIVRNSWGEYFGDRGYFYISYEDMSLGAGNLATVFTATTVDKYDNNYFNSNAGIYGYYQQMSKAVQIYEVNGNPGAMEQLMAVSVFFASTNTPYSIQVYKNPEDRSQPEGGTPMLATPLAGKTSYAGLYTLEMQESLFFEQGDVMAIVITFPNRNGAVYTDASATENMKSEDISYTFQYENNVKLGESFWDSLDLASQTMNSWRINVQTVNFDTDGMSVEEVTATAEGESGIKLSWKEVTVAEGYVIERKTSNGNFEVLEEVTAEITKYVDEDVESGKAYQYRVRAYSCTEAGQKLFGPYSSVAEAVVPLAAVVNVQAEVSEDKVVMISWDALSGAQSYEIYTSKDGENYTLAGKSTGTSYNWTEAAKGWVHYIRVIGVSAADERGLEGSPITVAVEPDRAEIIEIYCEMLGVNTIYYGLVEEADEYVLYCSKEENGTYEVINSKKQSTEYATFAYSHQGLEWGVPYYYKLQTVLNGIETSLEDTPAVMAIPSGDGAKILSTDASSITIEVKDYLEYAVSTVYGETEGLSYIKAGEGQYTFKGLSENTCYYIYVRMSTGGSRYVYGQIVEAETQTPAKLILSQQQAVISKGNSIVLTAVIWPENIHYSNLQWSALKEDGESSYVTRRQGEVFSVLGSDDKEILRISEGVVYGTGESVDKKVILRANKGAMQDECRVEIHVPVTQITLTGDTENMKVSDTRSLSVNYEPAFADATKVSWSVSDTSVAEISAQDDDTASVTAKGAGRAIIRATTPEGAEALREIVVEAEQILHGLWLTDAAEDMTGVKAERNEQGELAPQGAETANTYHLCKNGAQEDFPGSLQLAAYGLAQEDAVREGETITGGTLTSVTEVEYRSADPAVAVVNATGMVTAVAEGKTTIFAYHKKGSHVVGKAEILVEKASLPQIALNTTEAFLKPGGSMSLKATVSASESQEVLFTSSDNELATVSAKGKVTASKTALQGAESKTVVITCMLQADQTVKAECTIRIAAQPDYPLDKGFRLSAAIPAPKLQLFENNEKSACQLYIKNQYGEIQDTSLFAYTSANTELCMVDENGCIRPNPSYTGNKNKTVKITAALKSDPAGREVSIQVTLLAKKQVDHIVLLYQEQDTFVPLEENEEILREFQKGESITLRADTYDSSHTLMQADKGFSLSDKSLATLTVNKQDGTVQVTFQKAGRLALTCQAKDDWKRKTQIRVSALTADPVISEKQVNLNRSRKAVDGAKSSDAFWIYAPDNASVEKPEIQFIKTGKKELSEEERANFSIEKNADESYSIQISQAEGYLDSIKKNTVYEIGISVEVCGFYKSLGIKEHSEDTILKDFSVKIKITDKAPSVSIGKVEVNTLYTEEAALTSLLVLKAPEVVTQVEIKESTTENKTSLEQYFSVAKKNGQWYLTYSDPHKTFRGKKAAGTLRITVEGYEPVEKSLSVSVLTKTISLKQSSVPVIDLCLGDSVKTKLWNATDKKELLAYRITGVESTSLTAVRETNGELLLSVLPEAQVKNGATLKANITVMASGRDDIAAWTKEIKVPVKVKVYTTTKPAVTWKSGSVTLNRQTIDACSAVSLSINRTNGAIKDSSEWNILAYNTKTKSYDTINEEQKVFSFTYEEETGKLWTGFDEAEKERLRKGESLLANGSYKFRIVHYIKGYDELYKDFTVKVIDKAASASVKMSGKLDLVNRKKANLTGKVTLKDCTSEIIEIKAVDGQNPQNLHPYFTAEQLSGNQFELTLTEEGKKAALTTDKIQIPLKVKVSGGTVIDALCSVKPVQSTPKVATPSTQTVYKSAGSSVKDYNLAKGLAEGIVIREIKAVTVPQGINVLVQEGHAMVTVSDRSLKPGTYQIKLNLYFEGAQPVSGSPNGKPVVKTIKIKIME